MNVILAGTLLKCGSTFLLAFGLALYLVPKLRDAAIAMKIVDTPDGKLKNHRQPVPYLGGLGVDALSITTGEDYVPELSRFFRKREKRASR